ncbi:MAG: UDP-3-O-(3-hydroxymyristoyl)glucosamine N-acyltransferase [Gammaproteobacteria bacterium]|nr:UDP-3-O-(3-hydroxymyristoyl)glucosamine N-acyltransferase [Gammaproteobacteria bacterium]MDH5661325.1 UDP-3-O-(3-hydroxymyristoyl)glucosamine N-acyltransferase [Gammaproteobacteria bacterium]
MKYTLGELAEHVSGIVKGDASCEIDGVGTLHNADSSQISFLTNPQYRKQLAFSKAGAVIMSASDAENCSLNAIISSNPYAAYAKIAALISADDKFKAGIDPAAHIAINTNISSTASIAAGAIIESGVTIAEYVRIGPGCVLQENVKIGANSFLTANVTVVHDCEIGERNIIHPGVVIGSDGFGQAMDNGKWIKVPQLGKVVIGDDVEIGANTTIDRGAIDDTIIEDNVKLDNQIQIGHNVKIGAHTAIAASAAIAGSTIIGKHCKIAGMVGIVGHINIADNVMITGKSMVSHSIKKAGVYSSGTTLEQNSQWRKNTVRFKYLDDMAKRLNKLEKQLTGKNESGE